MVAVSLALLSAWMSATDAPAPLVVAVFEVHNSSDLDDAKVTDLSAYLRVKMAERSGFRIIDKGEQQAELERLIDDQRLASYEGCIDEACQIPLGKELAANQILRGRIARFGRRYMLTLEMVDLVTGTAAQAVSDASDGSDEGLLGSVDRAIARLANDEKEATAEAPTVVEAYARAGGTAQGALFDGARGAWSAGALAGLRFREIEWLWGDVNVGAVLVDPDAVVLHDLPRAAARIELAQWMRFALFRGERTALLPSDRGSVGAGIGGYLLLPGGVGAVLAGQLDLWWFTGRAAFVYDTVAQSPGVEVSVGLRADLPI